MPVRFSNDWWPIWLTKGCTMRKSWVGAVSTAATYPAIETYPVSKANVVEWMFHHYQSCSFAFFKRCPQRFSTIQCI
jgi:hypothetical protein